MPEAKTYTGGCHCGKVRYEVTTDLAKVITCNCSRCSKSGMLLTFVPAAQFKLMAGEGSLTEYLFNTGKIRHLFCRDCGIESFATGEGPGGAAMAAINVRCLDGVDIASLTLTPFNGKDF
jgi:hypothetical protein